MSDHITTEEAEKIAFALQGRAMEVTGAGELVYDEELRDAADALRSLAAERDKVSLALRKWYAYIGHGDGCECDFCEATRAALGEERG